MKHLLLSGLLVVALPALATSKLKSTKSNTSEKVICQTPACCIQHPNANGCTGSLLKSQSNLPRHPRDTGPQPPSSVTTPVTVKGSKSNASFKEAEPTQAVALDSKNSAHASEKRIHADGAGSEKNTTVKTTHSNTYKEAEPTPGVTPTPRPVTATTVHGSKSNTSFKEAEPTPAPEKTQGHEGSTEKNINLNSSRSN